MERIKDKPGSKSILEEASKIIEGARQADYSDPVENFERIAKIASVLNSREETPVSCCNVLIAVKLAREAFRHKRDNLVDLAGYAEILNRMY